MNKGEDEPAPVGADDVPEAAEVLAVRRERLRRGFYDVDGHLPPALGGPVREHEVREGLDEEGLPPAEAHEVGGGLPLIDEAALNGLWTRSRASSGSKGPSFTLTPRPNSALQ